MEFNQYKTNEVKSNPKYKGLLQWGIENGVLMKGVDFPASFGDVIGVVASEDLPSDTVIICIPQSLIISPEKCKQSTLITVYNNHPEMFDEEETNEAEFNILTFYMFNEKKKGEQSFYYPYIQAIQTNNTLMAWSNEDLQKIEDPLILEEFQLIKQDFLGLWSKAKLIFDNAQDVFGAPRISDKSDFFWAIECVMSRCFGWALKSTCLVPIADFLNHSNKACTHYMVHSALEKGSVSNSEEQANFERQYVIKRNNMNLSILGIEADKEIQKWEDEKIKFILGNKQCLRDQNLLEDLERSSINEQRDIINMIHYEQIIQDPKLNIWDQDSLASSDSEDNDSDEEVKLEKFQEFEILKIKELAEWKIREEQKRIEKEFQSINLKNQPIVTVTLNPEKKNKVIIRGLPQYQIEAIKAKQQIINGRLRKQKEEKILSQVDDVQSREDQQWDWLDEYDQEAYFCITTTAPIKKFEQVTVSYGKRTNRFLLCWYGFALLENVYSSFNFRLWLNTEILEDKEKSLDQILNTIIIKKLIYEDESMVDKILYNGYEIPISSLSKEFRIKKNKLDMDIISILRLFLQIKYGKEKDLLSTIPMSIDYEIVVMQFYYSMLQNLMKSYSQDLVQDLKELEQTFEYPKRFAIYINKERKEILISQSQIVEEAITILKRFKETQKLRDCYVQNMNIETVQTISIIKGLKDYLKLLYEFL